MAYILGRDGAGDLVKLKVDTITDGADEVNLQKVGVSVTWEDFSGTITTGGTAQDALTANALRRTLRIINPDTEAERLWVCYTGTATIDGIASGSFYLDPGDQEIVEGTAVTPGAVSLNAATTGHEFFLQEGI